jgi:CDP-diacylglycerol---glycerol-3-phosphate 3-phosphatidyltransferase
VSVTRQGASARLMGITYLRIALIPVVMALVSERAYGWAAVVFGVAAATDFLDGYLARRWRQTTALGSFLDTTADKLLVSAALIALVAVGRAPAWAAAIIVGRELLILGLRAAVAGEGTVMAPSLWGKLKANFQFAAILLAMLRPPVRLGGPFLDEWAMTAAAFVTVMSAVEYMTRYGGSLIGPRR